VELSLWPEDGRVWKRIADNGSGMTVEALPHIYDPFFREPGTARRPGAGLGLTIVRWIVREHSGEIKIESAPGQGTAVTLAFPEFIP
jgi:signal transduction histidine kinase